MSSLENRHLARAVLAAMTTALAATLAGCNAEPVTGTLGNDRNRSAQSAAPTTEQPSAPRAASAQPVANAGKAVEDEALSAKVKSALIAEQTLSQSLGIDVAAAGGEVTLKGVARNHSDREKAMQVASSVEGVRSVRNDLVVNSGS